MRTNSPLKKLLMADKPQRDLQEILSLCQKLEDIEKLPLPGYFSLPLAVLTFVIFGYTYTLVEPFSPEMKDNAYFFSFLLAIIVITLNRVKNKYNYSSKIYKIKPGYDQELPELIMTFLEKKLEKDSSQIQKLISFFTSISKGKFSALKNYKILATDNNLATVIFHLFIVSEH